MSVIFNLPHSPSDIPLVLQSFSSVFTPHKTNSADTCRICFYLSGICTHMWAQVQRKRPNLLLCHWFSNGKLGLGRLFNCFGHVHQKGATPINPLDGAVSCPAPAPPGRAVSQGRGGWGGVGGEAHGNPLPTMGTKSIPSVLLHHHPPSTSMDLSSVYANNASMSDYAAASIIFESRWTWKL